MTHSTSWKRNEAHGHMGDSHWALPKLVTQSSQISRPDQQGKIFANEYLDDTEVLQQKIKKLAALIRESKFCIAYTGAGLSKASGIPDYATKQNSIVGAPKLRSSLDAQPTYAHHVLTAMERAGYLKHIVQQNHDGLPQKAGFPQEKINEIHGAWFDPSNPVVPFSGSLRSDLFQWMLEVEARTDLCLCLGTSLSGMNADRVARTPAKFSLRGGALGTVIINLQKTPLDAESSIRIWAKLDDAFRLLAQELHLTVKDFVPQYAPGNIFTLLYDKHGAYNKEHTTRLDLREGSEVYIAAREACNRDERGMIAGQDREGNYLIRFESGATRLLGRWWIDAAVRGAIPQLPICNIETSPKLQIVQSHHLLTEENNSHVWSLQLEGDLSLVEQVSWRLHPTFSPSIIRVTEAPFSIERRGWGTFKVYADIQFKNAEVTSVAHSLSFDGEGARTKITQITNR